MTKHNSYLFFTAGTLALSALFASAYNISEYKAGPAVRLNIPALPDSTQKENSFKPEKLLDARKLNAELTANWTTVTSDTAGRVLIKGNNETPVLNSFTTRLRAERFAKGRLVLKSTARAAVKVNGKTLITKATSDSTLVSAESPLNLDPEADYEIAVDVLGLPEDKSAPEFSLEFIPADDFNDVNVISGPNLKKRVSPSTTMIGERTSQLRLSPSGKYLISITREVYSAKESHWRASLIETATGNVISNGISVHADWIPGKTDAYWNSVKRNGVYDIYQTDVPSMRSRLIAKGLPDDNITMSPNGRDIFYYDNVQPEKENGIMHRYKNPDDRIPGDRDRSYIMRYDLNDQVATVLTYGGPSTIIFDFDRTGSKLLYASTIQTPDHYPFYNTTLVEMDLNTLKTDTLISRMESGITNAVYSPDGKELFVTAGPDAFGGIGANYAPHEIGNDFDGQGYIFNIAKRSARAVTKNFDPAVIAGSIWNYADNNIYFLAEAGFDKNIYKLDPKTDKIVKLPTEAPYVRSFSIGENEAEWLAYIGNSFTNDGAAYLLNLKKNSSKLISDPLSELTDGIEFGKMEPWNFTAKDGTVVEGWYCLPPNFDASKKYPMIVYYYGGTSPCTATFFHLYSPQVFASRDYVVYVLNPSGTTGYGQEYSARHVNAWGKRTAEEIIEGTKLFCKEHKFVNEKKIGCIGASYGGFMTQYLQTLTDIYAAAVSHAGISNVTSYWGEGFWGYSYNSVAAAKSYPWNNPDLFTKQGSLFNADKIHTPLLLLHGTEDTNVPIGESIQLFNALRILGRDVEFITVQDENHVISGFDQKLAWQNTIMAWFAKYLQDDPRWWNELYVK
ncbi:MAG: S9 family peptidase [Bacteroidales bacterium]|nr:S9 family peptidase [Bacteroidales bacterium]